MNQADEVAAILIALWLCGRTVGNEGCDVRAAVIGESLFVAYEAQWSCFGERPIAASACFPIEGP